MYLLSTTTLTYLSTTLFHLNLKFWIIQCWAAEGACSSWDDFGNRLPAQRSSSSASIHINPHTTHTFSSHHHHVVPHVFIQEEEEWSTETDRNQWWHYRQVVRHYLEWTDRCNWAEHQWHLAEQQHYLRPSPAGGSAWDWRWCEQLVLLISRWRWRLAIITYFLIDWIWRALTSCSWISNTRPYQGCELCSRIHSHSLHVLGRQPVYQRGTTCRLGLGIRWSSHFKRESVRDFEKENQKDLLIGPHPSGFVSRTTLDELGIFQSRTSRSYQGSSTTPKETTIQEILIRE